MQCNDQISNDPSTVEKVFFSTQRSNNRDVGKELEEEEKRKSGVET